MITLKINNKEFQLFSNLNISLNYSGFVSTFSFSVPFDSELDVHRQLFQPLAYNLVQIYFNNKLLLTGPIISNGFLDEDTPTNATLSGYSLTGILQDVNIPTSLYPMESNQRTLKEIVERLIQPFGLKLQFNAPDKKYEKTVAAESESIGDYIQKLCDQRNLRLSHNESGSLVISQPSTNSNVIKTTFNNSYKASKASLAVDGQSIFSEYTAVKQAAVGDNVQAENTQKFPIKYRPIVQVQQDGEQGDIESFAKAMRSNGGRAIRLTLTLDRWTNSSEEIYLPGDIVNYQNYELSLYKFSQWFVESVNLREESKQEVATLNLVPDWVIYDKQPSNPFT